MRPIEVIDALKDTDPYIETIYMQGGCYRFHLFLSKLFPDATPVKNERFDHIATVIGGECYDINGIVSWRYYPLSVEEITEAEQWSFTGNSYLSLGDCPNCDEPLLVY